MAKLIDDTPLIYFAKTEIRQLIQTNNAPYTSLAKTIIETFVKRFEILNSIER